MATRPVVLIVGAGFAGLTTARTLRSAPVDVVLVDRANHHLFQPLLYQVAMAGLSPADIAYPVRSVLARQSNARSIMAEVREIDRPRRTVVLADGSEQTYDYLVLAAGAKSNYFGKEATWGPHTFGLKTIDDATALRRQVLLTYEAAGREIDTAVRRRLLTFVVVGGGPTGVEVAGALAELARAALARQHRELSFDEARVVLVEAQDRVLPAFTPQSSAAARRHLEQLGVHVRVGAQVTQVGPGGVTVGDDVIESQTVVWTAGVKARHLASALGTPLDGNGRVRVGPDCSVAGNPELFAIGDIACFVPEGTDAPLPGLAPVAIQQGRHVATAIRRDIAGRPRPTFRYLDKGVMATIGRSRAVAEIGRWRIAGSIAWVAWLLVHLLFLIGFRNRLAVLLNWA